ncbi:MAG: alkaline phytoceramidase [Deltaproteobacteria bacterium]|nr:MAG: alkaline phytoceramidase [Deltaproteobacteria bacterium]
MAKRATAALWLTGCAGVISMIGLSIYGPIPQDPGYHLFADQRQFLGIPHFFNVVSNLAFLVVGIAGVAGLRNRSGPGLPRPLRPAYFQFFIAAILTGAGSAYYHLAPGNQTLAWDRLAMALGFMAFVTIVIGEHVNLEAARRVRLPLTVVGVAAVLYWAVSESQGQGDLRLYVVVQFLPMVLVPLVLLTAPPLFGTARHLWMMLACYAGAKLFEALDLHLYELGRLVSGHTLKHLLAAYGMWFMVQAVRQRRVE